MRPTRSTGRPRMRTRASAGVAAVLTVLAAGCAGDGAQGAASTVAPPLASELAACDGRDDQVDVDEGNCLEAIRATLVSDSARRADGGVVTQRSVSESVSAINQTLRVVYVGAWSYRTIEPAPSDPDGTAPFEMAWDLGLEPVRWWVCFAGGDVSVGESPCS